MKNTFAVSMIISLVLHAAILFQKSNFDIFSKNTSPDKTKTNYIYQLKQPQKYIPNQKDPNDGAFLNLPSHTNVRNKMDLLPINTNETFKTNNKDGVLSRLPFMKPALAKPDIVAVKEKVVLSMPDLTKPNTSAYVNYSSAICDKIKYFAIHNYTHVEVGKVYVSFVLAKAGNLKTVRITEEKSKASDYLKEITLKSLQDASPFLSFPKELDYSELSFNIEVFFELE